MARRKIMSINLKQYEVWFVTGSQHLYGPETLKAVAKHSQEIAGALNAAAAIPVKVVFKPVMVSPDAITPPPVIAKEETKTEDLSKNPDYQKGLELDPANADLPAKIAAARAKA